MKAVILAGGLGTRISEESHLKLKPMIQDLLKGFVYEEWVAQLDFGSLEKVNGSYVSDNLRDREDDVVWRVKFRDQWLYVYLLLEFQSTVDTWEAGRLPN